MKFIPSKKAEPLKNLSERLQRLMILESGTSGIIPHYYDVNINDDTVTISGKATIHFPLSEDSPVGDVKVVMTYEEFINNYYYEISEYNFTSSEEKAVLLKELEAAGYIRGRGNFSRKENMDD